MVSGLIRTDSAVKSSRLSPEKKALEKPTQVTLRKDGEFKLIQKDSSGLGVSRTNKNYFIDSMSSAESGF